MAATIIGRATIVDDTGGGLDGTVLNSAWFGTAIYDKVDALFVASQTIEASSSGSNITHTISNASNTANSGAGYNVYVAGSSAKDPYLYWSVVGSQGFTAGIDNSDSDAWKLSASAALGTSDAITVSTTRSVVLYSDAVATNATDGFLYITSCAGTPTGTPTAYTGRVPIVFDSTNNKIYVFDSGWIGVTVS